MNIGSFHRVLPVAALLLVSTVVTSCGSGEDDTPAICSSVDSLESSVAEVTDVNVDEDALATLRADLDQVQSDLGQVLSDAKDEYAAEIDSVEQATSRLGSSLDAAVVTRTVQSVSAVGTAVQALGTSLRSLADAVEGTC